MEIIWIAVIILVLAWAWWPDYPYRKPISDWEAEEGCAENDLRWGTEGEP